jgi:hypothetical protein
VASGRAATRHDAAGELRGSGSGSGIVARRDAAVEAALRDTGQK